MVGHVKRKGSVCKVAANAVRKQKHARDAAIRVPAREGSEAGKGGACASV